MSSRIEFYKSRSIGDRFSVAFDFLKQNWKPLYKNVLIGGLPLAIAMGYLITQVSGSRTIGSLSPIDLPHFIFFYVLLLLVSFVNSIYLYSMSASVLHWYERNRLTEATGWNELKDTFFRFAGKTTVITILVIIPFILLFAIFAFILGFVSSFSISGMQHGGFFVLIALFILFFLGIIIAIAPSLTMQYFPAYFSGKTSIESIKIAFVLGFKNWGSLFVAIILTIIVLIIFSFVFSLPYQVVSLFSMGRVTIFSYIFAILSAIGTMLIYPIIVVIFAFQYFSIVEKDEGVSLQSQLNDFENL